MPLSAFRSETSRPFAKPTSGRIAVKVINHLGDEVMKGFRISRSSSDQHLPSLKRRT